MYVVYSNVCHTAVGHGYYFRLNCICQGNGAICWLFAVGVKKTNCNTMMKDSIHQMLQYAARQWKNIILIIFLPCQTVNNQQ